MSKPIPAAEKAVMFDEICDRLAGGESLRAICSDPHMPDLVTVYRWIRADEELRQRYARAREEQADTLFDQIQQIADDGLNDTYVDDEGRVRVDHEVVARSKLRIEARKWLAGKLRPKVYGDKIEVEHSGSVALDQRIVEARKRAGQ